MRLMIEINLHFAHPLSVQLCSDSATGKQLAEINHKLDNLAMKLSEIKAAVADAAAKSTEAFAELSPRIADLQAKIDQLVADASDPDVTDEAFLKDLTTVQTNAKQLADIVPDAPAPAPPAA